MAKSVTTTEERTATAESGQIAKEEFSRETDAQKDSTVYAVEELAAMYIAVGGDDPRAVAVFAAGQKAGRIDKDGKYTGPHRDLEGDIDQGGVEAGLPPGTQRARDPSTGDNACAGPNGCGGLTQLSARRKDQEGISDADMERLLKELSEGDDD